MIEEEALMTKDRDYYRALPTHELLDEVKFAIIEKVDWQELAIALAERLRKKNFELQDYRYEAKAEREGY